MKKKVLFTGGTGFLGKNILPVLKTKFDIDAPLRDDLDLCNQKELRRYIKRNSYDIIFHGANPNPSKNNKDSLDKMLRDSLEMFLNIYNTQDLVKRIFYVGSGAEFGKQRDISTIRENDFGKVIPIDDYGIAKYIMNMMTLKSNNIINLRMFGCYGPYDHSSKFITHVIKCCLNNEPINIRQNCWFDYMHVYDFANIAAWFMETNELELKDYNICSGIRITLKELAEKICIQMGKDIPLHFDANGYNKEYTASNERLIKVIGDYKFINIDDGIKMQIEWQKKE